MCDSFNRTPITVVTFYSCVYLKLRHFELLKNFVETVIIKNFIKESLMMYTHIASAVPNAGNPPFKKVSIKISH